MMENGFVKVYRSLLQWEWYGDVNTCRVFVHLLLTANYKQARWQGVVIKRGQRVISLKNLAKECGLSVQQVRTVLKKLEKTGEIELAPSVQYTVVSVCKYDKYQADGTQTAEAQHGGNTEPTSNKEGKKERNLVINDKIVRSHEWRGYVEMRNRLKKPLTENAKIIALKRLKSLAPENEELQKQILEQSTFNCWQGLFAIKQNEEVEKNGVATGKGPTLSATVRL